MPITKFVEMAVINLLDDLEEADESSMWSPEELFADLEKKVTKGATPGRPGRPVLRVEDGVVFASAGLAAASVNGCIPSIYGVVKGKQKTAYGYHWKWAD